MQDKRMKRGQIALFVIIAVLLVATIGLIVYLQRETLLRPATSPEIRPITAEIDGCLESTAENGLYLLGLQGGYIELPPLIFETNLSTLGYAYHKGRTLFPLKTRIEKDLAAYINTMLPGCPDFGKWPDFSVSPGSVSSDVTIKQQELLVEVDWPLTFEKGTASYSLEKFSAKLPVRIGLLYNITSTIVQATVLDPGHVDISYLVALHENFNITADLIPYNKTIIYSLTDPHSAVLGRPYVFLVAVGF